MACDTFVRGGVCLSNGLICEKNKAKSASMKFSSPVVRRDDEVAQKAATVGRASFHRRPLVFEAFILLHIFQKAQVTSIKKVHIKNRVLVQYLKPFTIAHLSRGPT